MFLMIENAGVAPVQSFTVLGLSTARGKADKIGQFGSGSKHGILACMRQGINPVIFLGEDELKFSTVSDKMGDKDYQHLAYTFKGQAKELPIALEFGALDWNGLDMGLREFVSNAIDAGEYRVEIVNNIEAMDGKTRIFLPFNPDVSKFYSSLRDKFLHFNPQFNPSLQLITKNQQSIPRFYRKGVFVREMKDCSSLFDYNFGDSIKIDESRNMDDWAVKHHASKMMTFADKETIKHMFDNLSKFNEKLFENSLTYSSYDLKYGEKERAQAKTWLEAWNETFGENSVAAHAETQGQLIAKAQSKGQTVICVPFNIFMICDAIGVKKVNSVLDKVDEKGREITAATSKVIEQVRKIWEKLEKLQVTKGKSMPVVNTFICLSEGQTNVHGFYNPADNSINLEKESGINTYVILHELGHYITGADDNTHDFTDFFCKVASILLNKCR